MKNLTRIFCIFLTAVIFSFFSGCAITNKITAQKINENSNFDFKLFTPLLQCDFSNYSVIEGYGITGYYLSSIDFNSSAACVQGGTPIVIYSVSKQIGGMIGEQVVTRIECYSPNYQLFGCSVNGSSSTFKTALLSNGFTLLDESPHSLRVEKGRVIISLSVNNTNSTVTSFMINVY
ncbi:MAG: hypothetical protein IJW13_05205 [Clostridia bacterium]|nr:hypothetical protein [Clostridia bacterium]